MKLLTMLNPQWLGRLRPDSGEGISFDCPACGPSHRLAAYFRNPLDRGPAMETIGAASWKRAGDDFDSLTLEPSIEYPCWHGWLIHGVALKASEGLPASMPDGSMRMLSPIEALRLRASGEARVVAGSPPGAPEQMDRLKNAMGDVDARGMAMAERVTAALQDATQRGVELLQELEMERELEKYVEGSEEGLLVHIAHAAGVAAAGNRLLAWLMQRNPKYAAKAKAFMMLAGQATPVNEKRALVVGPDGRPLC